MERFDILQQIQNLTGSTNEQMNAFEKYSTSDLKRILNDMLTFRVKTDPSVNTTIIFAGIIILLIIYIAK